MSGGVALLVLYNVTYTQRKSLETKGKVIIVAAANICGLKILPTTAYLKLEEKGEPCALEKNLKHVNRTRILFFGDCNAMHYYLGDQKCNDLGNDLRSL